MGNLEDDLITSISGLKIKITGSRQKCLLNFDMVIHYAKQCILICIIPVKIWKKTMQPYPFMLTLVKLVYFDYKVIMPCVSMELSQDLSTILIHLVRLPTASYL